MTSQCFDIIYNPDLNFKIQYFIGNQPNVYEFEFTEFVVNKLGLRLV